MRHSIMGERDGIDKERAEIGMSGLWSGAAVPRGSYSGTASYDGLQRGVSLLRNPDASELRRVDIGRGR
jgi:hypothetical protein